MATRRRELSDSLTSLRTAHSDGHQPRHRPTPLQRQALQTVFSVKSHPTREERVTLGNEIGMDFKCVTMWFQNKRSATRKQALFPRKTSRSRSMTSVKSSSSTGSLRQTASLDVIAGLSERPSNTTVTKKASFPRLPLTPRRGAKHLQPQQCTELWERMLSSPVHSPSRGADTARLSILPDRSKRSLEWACAKARVSGLHSSEKENGSPLPSKPGMKSKEQDQQVDEDTDTEDDEAITPDASLDVLPVFVAGMHGAKEMPKSKDIEAAMVLLDFMRR